MKSFKAIDDLIFTIESGHGEDLKNIDTYRNIIKENMDLIQFLKFLEKTNPCDQEYFLHKKVIIISYIAHWDFIKFGRNHSIKGRFRIIGLPISLSNPGYLIADKDETSRMKLAAILKEVADHLKGITIVLNSDIDISSGRLAPSTFVFYNNFISFNDFLSSIRSNYRRKINKIMDKGKKLNFIQLGEGCFSEAHYDLYLNVCERAPLVFRILSFEYFRDCDAEIFEVKDEVDKLLAFIQLKEIENDLYFLYVGFKKEEVNKELNSIDLYYNLLLFIIRYGIKNRYKKIVFGQTSAESKCKVGCTEELKYSYMTSANLLIRNFFRLFPNFYSFKPYGIHHNMFK